MDADDPQSEHWCGLQPDPTDRLSIRRSLVRAQVEEPIKSKGYVARRNPFLFAILESGSASCASSLSPIATPRPSSGPSTERREPASRRAPPQARQELCPLAGVAPKVKHSPLSTHCCRSRARAERRRCSDFVEKLRSRSRARNATKTSDRPRIDDRDLGKG